MRGLFAPSRRPHPISDGTSPRSDERVRQQRRTGDWIVPRRPSSVAESVAEVASPKGWASGDDAFQPRIKRRRNRNHAATNRKSTNTELRPRKARTPSFHTCRFRNASLRGVDMRLVSFRAMPGPMGNSQRR